MKTCYMAYKNATVGPRYSQIVNKPSTNCQILEDFAKMAKSGHTAGYAKIAIFLPLKKGTGLADILVENLRINLKS